VAAGGQHLVTAGGQGRLAATSSKRVITEAGGAGAWSAESANRPD
jgi:hypothetical protein